MAAKSGKSEKRKIGKVEKWEIGKRGQRLGGKFGNTGAFGPFYLEQILLHLSFEMMFELFPQGLLVASQAGEKGEPLIGFFA